MGDNLFSSNFEKFLPFDEYRDFTFIVNGKLFKIHRVVFAAQSNVFVQIFKANKHEVVLDDVNELIFEEIVKFMYSNHIDITDKTESELLAFAEKYGLREIVNSVQLKRNLRMDPLKVKELEALKHKYDEAEYLLKKARERYSKKNLFSQTSTTYY